MATNPPQPSPAIVTSKLRRAASLWVHIIPSLASCIIIYFNAIPFYIGAHLAGPTSMEDDAKLDALQGAAKLHEITMVASMGTFVLDVVRYHLLCDQGLPMGLVGSGFNFSQSLFLISGEFWGSILGCARSFLWKLLVAWSIFMLCFIANSVGPASAILMLPKNQTWPTAHYDFFLNGTIEDLWPAELREQHVGGDNCSNFESVMRRPSCNAGGFPVLSQYFSTFKTYPQSHAFHFDTQDGIGKMNFEGNIRNGWSRGSETWIKAPHLATVMVQEPIRSQWNYHLRDLKGRNGRRLDYSNIRTASVKTEIPAARVACAPALNSSMLSRSSLDLEFPILPEYDYWFWPPKTSEDDDEAFGVGQTDYAHIDVSSITQNITGGDPRSLVIRTRWVELPKSFGSVSGGLAVLIFLRNEDGDLAQFQGAMGCSVDPRWTSGVNWQTTSRSDWAWAGLSKATQSTISERRVSPNNYGGERHFLPIDNGSWRRIRLSQEWLEALTPTVPGRDTSTIGMVLEDQIPQLVKLGNLNEYFDPRSPELVPFVEHVVSALLVDGITRVGTGIQPSIRTLREIFGYTLPEHFSKGSPEVVIGLPSQEMAMTKMRMTTEIQGYAYLLSGAAAYFAAGVLGAHLLIVLIHTLWVAFSGVHSPLLGTISELLILTIGSTGGQTRPPLPSTSRSGQQSQAYGKNTVISPVSNPNKVGSESLQLTFGARGAKIERDERYD